MLAGIMPIARPTKIVVNISPAKLVASPRDAPASPANEQAKIRMRFAPKRSASKPATKTVNKPDSGKNPQVHPTSTRLNPRSAEISLNSTDMHIWGIAMQNVRVRASRLSTYHRYLDSLYSFTINKPYRCIGGTSTRIINECTILSFTIV